MGQHLSRRRQRKKTSEVRGEFKKFSSLPYDIRFLIYDLSIPGPRIVEVKRSSGSRDWSWVSTCHPPAVLQVCRESRAIALKHYTFCHSDKMRVYLNPLVDTLFFGPFKEEFALMEFIPYVNVDDIKSLKRLAIHEMHLATWRFEPYRTDSQKIGGFASKILDGLERLMIGVEVESEGYPNTAKLRPDDWPGWLFGGGPRTTEEDETLTGSNPHLVMSAHSWDGHLFHISVNMDAAAYPGSLPFKTAIYGYPKHKLLRYYYPPDPDRLGLRKHGQPPISEGMLMRQYEDVVSWYRMVYRAVARADVCVKRIFEMHKRENVENLEMWEPPRAASFVRPAGSFLTWKQCLEPICDAEWSSYQDLSRFAIEGKGKGHEQDERDMGNTIPGDESA